MSPTKSNLLLIVLFFWLSLSASAQEDEYLPMDSLHLPEVIQSDSGALLVILTEGLSFNKKIEKQLISAYGCNLEVISPQLYEKDDVYKNSDIFRYHLKLVQGKKLFATQTVRVNTNTQARATSTRIYYEVTIQFEDKVLSTHSSIKVKSANDLELVKFLVKRLKKRRSKHGCLDFDALVSKEKTMRSTGDKLRIPFCIEVKFKNGKSSGVRVLAPNPNKWEKFGVTEERIREESEKYIKGLMEKMENGEKSPLIAKLTFSINVSKMKGNTGYIRPVEYFEFDISE